MKKEKRKLEETIKEINTDAGNRIAYTGKDAKQDIEVVSTGMLPLDFAIGCGGFPKGRIIEMHGLQSVGKTSLALGITAEFQRKNLTCAFVDAEFALDLDHARNLGVDTDKLLIVQPDTGEQAFEAIEKLVRQNTAQFIVVDSVPALVPRAVIEAETGKPTMGALARLMSQGLAKLVGPAAKNGTIILFLNQLRANIMGGQYDPYTVTGGMALRFYTTIILELKKDKGLMQGDELKGYSISIKVKKNKVGKPMEKCVVQLVFESGFSAEADILSIGEKAGLITRSGNTYSYRDTKLGIGYNKAREFLTTNPELAQEILSDIQRSVSPESEVS